MGATAAAGGACPTPEIPVKPTPTPPSGGGCWTAVRVVGKEVEVATAAAATLFI